MLSTSLSLCLARALVVCAGAALAIACSNNDDPQVTGTASVTGPSVESFRSAALIISGSITEAGPVGTASTYVQFFTDPPGTSCSSPDAGTTTLAGSLAIPGSVSDVACRTLTFGQTPDVFLTLSAAASPDASVNLDGGEAAPSAAFVAVSGTVVLQGLSDGVFGTIDAQMVHGTDPGSATVHVTGTFTAPLCGD